jgi:hypothetical protein
MDTPLKQAHEYKAKYSLNARKDNGSALATKNALNAVYSKTPEG